MTVVVFLLLLVLRRLSFDGAEDRVHYRLVFSRLVCFVVLHLSAIEAFRIFSNAGTETTQGSPLLWTMACKFLVFLPSGVLLPVSEWRRLTSRYGGELVSAGVALLTFFPYRLFALVWPIYSQVLGHFVFALAGFFVPGLGYQPSANPLLTGPALDIEIEPGCSGLDGIRVFQLVFALLLVTDWDRLQRRRALVGYFTGIGWVLLSNGLRIVIMVVLGNRVSADLVARYHLSAGWIFFTAVVLTYILGTYRWLLAPRPPVKSSLIAT